MEDLETMVFWCHLLKRQVTGGAAKHWVFSKKSSNKKFVCVYTSLRKTGSISVSAASKVVRICKLLLLS